MADSFTQGPFEVSQNDARARRIAAFKFHLHDAFVLDVDSAPHFVNAVIKFEEQAYKRHCCLWASGATGFYIEARARKATPWTTQGFKASWRKNLPSAIREGGYVFHGLRKRAVVMLLAVPVDQCGGCAATLMVRRDS